MESSLLCRTDSFHAIIWLLGVVFHFYLIDSGAFCGREPNWTHNDAFVLAADSHVVAFPEHGGLRMSTWRHTLQHRRLAGSHHHIAGCLPKIVSQDYDGNKGTELVFGSRQMNTLIKTNTIFIFSCRLSYTFWHENKLIEGNKVTSCVLTAGTPTNVLTKLLFFTLPTNHVLLCCLSRQGG